MERRCNIAPKPSSKIFRPIRRSFQSKCSENFLRSSLAKPSDHPIKPAPRFSDGKTHFTCFPRQDRSFFTPWTLLGSMDSHFGIQLFSRQLLRRDAASCSLRIYRVVLHGMEPRSSTHFILHHIRYLKRSSLHRARLATSLLPLEHRPHPFTDQAERQQRRHDQQSRREYQPRSRSHRRGQRVLQHIAP